MRVFVYVFFLDFFPLFFKEKNCIYCRFVNVDFIEALSLSASLAPAQKMNEWMWSGVIALEYRIKWKLRSFMPRLECESERTNGKGGNWVQEAIWTRECWLTFCMLFRIPAIRILSNCIWFTQMHIRTHIQTPNEKYGFPYKLFHKMAVWNVLLK